MNPTTPEALTTCPADHPDASVSPQTQASATPVPQAPPDPPTPGPATPPSIAVIVPVYNMAHYLTRAILSAFWQLAPQDELIVIDDGSSDLGGDLGLGPLQERITWLRNPINRGLSSSLNRGIQTARADWIKFLDADDVLSPFALALVRLADPPIPPDVRVVAGGCHRVCDEVYVDFLCDTDQSLRDILHVNPMLPSAVFVRRAALLEVGLFDERIDFENDWDMWLKLHERFGLETFATSTTPVCYYWISDADRAKKHRHATVDGVPVREYFRRRYHAEPQD